MKLLAVCFTLFVTCASPAFAQVKVESGSLSGVTMASGIRVFKGIPYAAPPVGELRWRPPQPPAKW